jgi:GTP-binding protein HflX
MPIKFEHVPVIEEHALIIHPEISKNTDLYRSLEAVIEETEGLARAINLTILETLTLKVARIQAGGFFGSGQRKTVAAQIEMLEPSVVIVNHPLSPVQQRNLEKEWGVKVIDRTGLILEIFGARAQTKEGRLQVELAALDYQRSRLVRSWTHLERQRGGAGFMGGPGETQIELDRRMIGDRMVKLRKELDNVLRTRDLGRKSRERVPFPVVALVGYTNAGKSTLFNKLTDAGVFAEDLPFATLDPTLRRIKMPNGQEAILSDTVGFISNLPTTLVAAFRATLEQTIHGDAIIHVIDVSRPDWRAQRDDVIKILRELGINYDEDERILELFNKVDALDRDSYSDLVRHVKFTDRRSMVSALTGDGVEGFLDDVVEIIARSRVFCRYNIIPADGRALSWLYEHAEVLERKDCAEKITMDVMIDPADLNKFASLHGYSADKNTQQ